MKQFFFIALALVMFSCSGNRKKAEISVSTFELDQLLAVADQEVGNTVTVAGFVTHTCKHSGKRCFIIGESQAATLRVESGGDIEAFSLELVGSKLAITGVLQEHRLNQEVIDERETNVKHQQQEGASEEACEAELSNISNMRQWMKDHGKDYYVMYYMDGLKYEVLE